MSLFPLRKRNINRKLKVLKESGDDKGDKAQQLKDKLYKNINYKKALEKAETQRAEDEEEKQKRKRPRKTGDETGNKNKRVKK